MGVPTVDDPSGLNLKTNGNSAQGESNMTTAGVIGELRADRTTNGPKARVEQAIGTGSTNNVNIRISASPQPQPQPSKYDSGPVYAPTWSQYRSAPRHCKSCTRTSHHEGEENSDEDGDHNMRSCINHRLDPRGKLFPPPVPNADPDAPTPSTESNQQQIRYIEDLISTISTHFESLSTTLAGIEEMERVEELLDQVSTQRESKFNVAVDDGIGGLLKRIQATLSRCDALGPHHQNHANDGRYLVHAIENTLRGIEFSVQESWNIAEKLSDEAEKSSTSPLGETVRVRSNRSYKKKSDNRKRDAPAQLPSLRNLIGVVEKTDDHLKRLSSLVIRLDYPKLHRSSRDGGSDSGAIVIPQELVTTRHAAELIFDMLCRSCPSKDHSSHRLLLGLKTEPAEGEDGDDEVYVQFHLAFESGHRASERLWFRVTSRLTTVDNPMDPDNESNIEPQGGGVGGVAATSPSPTTSGSSYLHPSSSSNFRSRCTSFSSSCASPSVTAVEEAAVRFCISNHKQYANELAISLSNSAHRLFYPSRNYLDMLGKSNLKPLSKRLADKKHPPSVLDKFRWMRLIAEAVFKFDVTQRLSHNLDAENVWFCEFNSTSEIHWHIELLKPLPSSPSAARSTEGGGCNDSPGIVSISDTLRKLGALFLHIIIGSTGEQGQDEALKCARKLCGKPFSNFLKGWLDGRMGQTSDDFGRVEVQRLFYRQVVQQLRKREHSLLQGPGYGMLSASEVC